MTCLKINKGCPKLRKLNEHAESFAKAGNSSLWFFGNLSNWGFSKHNGLYVPSSCFAGPYENCMASK